MSKTLGKRIHLFYLVAFILVAALHLASVPPLLHPASWAKTALFRIIVSVIFLVFIYQVLFLDKSIIQRLKSYILDKKNPLFLPLWLLTGLWVIYLLATVFSLQPGLSFWSSPFRGLGSLTILLFIDFSILMFLMLKKKDWQMLWIANILVGILVSLTALAQKFALIPNIITPQTYRAFSTMGGSTILGIYLMLLIFPALSLGLRKISLKSIFYLGSVLLFIVSIMATATRSAILGLIMGLLFFLFFYPRKTKRIRIIKIAATGLIILSIIGAFWLNDNPETARRIEKIPVLGTTFYRIWESARPLLALKEINFEKLVSPGRYSGWRVLWPALSDRPVLGYGPENISIPFDKHYDPSIKGITSAVTGGGSGWWDRAHNIFLEKALTIGFPGLLIYISIFAVLFFKLQKIKKEKPITATGIQSVFIAYFFANFFNFDSFSTYLVMFTLIGYSLFLIKRDEPQEENNEELKPKLFKYVIITALLFIVAWFIWAGNISPMIINKDLNRADFAGQKGNCLAAYEMIEPLMLKPSLIDDYVRFKYIDIVGYCLEKHPEIKLEVSEKALTALDETKESRPYYTRTWTYSAIFLNKIMDSSPEMTLEEKQILGEQALENLKRAGELSPKRQDVFLTYVKTYLLMEELEKASEKAEECIEVSPRAGDCYWAKALALIAADAKNSEQTLEYIKKAISLGYTKEAYASLSHLIRLYIGLAEQTQDIKYYEILEQLYIEKIKFDYSDFQDHATLAHVYSLLGKYDKAREQAYIVLELSPESEPSVREFLDSLPE